MFMTRCHDIVINVIVSYALQVKANSYLVHGVVYILYTYIAGPGDGRRLSAVTPGRQLMVAWS